MPVYHKLGLSLKKRHTQFENQVEVLLRTTFGTEGFREIGIVIPCSPTYTRNFKSHSVEPKIAIGKNIKSLLLKGTQNRR
jgi:homogentisate 1,2-dioxygenase